MYNKIGVEVIDGMSMKFDANAVTANNLMRYLATTVYSQALGIKKGKDGIETSDENYNYCIEHYMSGINSALIINNLYTVVNFILQYMEALINSDEYPYLNGYVRKYDTNELEIYPLAIETALNIKLIGWKDDYLKETRYVIKQFKEKFDL